MEYRKKEIRKISGDENAKHRIRQMLAIWELMRRYWEGRASGREQEIIERWEPSERIGRGGRLSSRKLEEMNREVYERLAGELGFGRKVWTGWFPKVYVPVWQRCTACAAVVAIFLLVGGGSWLLFRQGVWGGREQTVIVANEYKTWSTTHKQRMRITLPDGTKVMMNGGSSLRLNKREFNCRDREIWLDGEAFFEVARDTTRLFVIHAGEMRTTVRGTSFNVKAYRDLEENVVSVRDGKVEVSEGERVLGLLTTDRQLIYDRERRTSRVADADWRLAAAWREGRLVFVKAGREELRLRFLQYFGAEVTFEGDVLTGKQLNGSFSTNDDLCRILDNISGLYGVRYSIDGKHVVIKK